MEAELVFALLIFLAIIILFIISKLNKAIRLLNNRINIHSQLIKKNQRAINRETEEEGDPDDLIRQVLERDFGGGDSRNY